ncbi:MAG: hypothetical protein UT43_C0002G0008 [Parcubacteria group bacterium GW2011_GWC1_39_29]|nr:MAG: hypothetical protein UT43_C0002G0008 [Parcubacteria group bacterium GW2011_GWC1_39_29]
MPADGNIKANKWDKPSREDLFGREPFVDTIVKTIKSSKEGFNLGISARWGEGKSSILEQLKPKLESLNYRVLAFSPWKYTQDQGSIKRKFIVDIYSQIGEKYDDSELYSSREQEKALKPDEYSVLFWSRIWLFTKFTGVTALIFLLALLIVQDVFGIDINITQVFLTNLFIPVLAGLLPLVTKLTEVTIKHSTPKIESAEQFEKVFNTAIEKIMGSCNPPERIIIFVDDLDRCNHVEVEQILTALFTFFNNKHCTYVITADHTVIRRYISSFLQLEDEVDEEGATDIKKTKEMRQKEATEYLKKIFQINFILPKIPSDMLEEWTKGLIDVSFVIVFKNPYAKDYLVNLILNNFQGNPRKIKHFIRTIEFQLEAISEKISRLADTTSEEYKNLNKVKDSPELLAKVLILQDRFPDFYEKIASEPKLLQKHEGGEISEDKDLQNLLAQEPKFFNSVTRAGLLKTIDPYYFLYFSGSTGFVETKVVDPAEIKALARSGDFEGLTKIINGLTDEPRNAQVEYIKLDFDSSEIQPPEKVNIVRSLFHVSSLIEEPTLRLQKLKDIFDSKTKYSTEFSSLQSVDFEKFISFLDLGTVNSLLADSPFIEQGLQGQILNAFISKQSEIGKGEIMDRFVQCIAEGVQKNDANSTVYVSLVKKLIPENFEGSDLIQDALIKTYALSADPLKQELFSTLLELNDNLFQSKKIEFQDILADIIKNNTIGEAVALLGNIPEKINKKNFDLSKLTAAINERMISLSGAEFEQLVNILVHPAVKAELNPKDMDASLSVVAGFLSSDDVTKRTYVRGKLPDFLTHVENKSAFLGQVIKSIEVGPLSESTETISVLVGMSDFWSSNALLKKEFASELKKGAKKNKDNDIKDLMNKTANEIAPPARKYL